MMHNAVEQPASVRASRYIRTMRGGAQAHLIEASDGHWYVVKSLQNPQGRRILINELISSILLRSLEVRSPAVAFVNIDAAFLKCYPECCVTQRCGIIPIQPGIHFGSRYPGPPTDLRVYDFLPTQMLPHVFNREDFFGMLVFDKWVSNADGRQAVFYKSEICWDGRVLGNHWYADAIDNGFAFQGCHWKFEDSPPQGVFVQPDVYGEPIALGEFDDWLMALMAIDSALSDELIALVPGEWIDQDGPELRRLLTRLWDRRDRVPLLLKESIEWTNARVARRRRRAVPPSCGPMDVIPLPVNRDMHSRCTRLNVVVGSSLQGTFAA